MVTINCVDYKDVTLNQCCVSIEINFSISISINYDIEIKFLLALLCTVTWLTSNLLLYSIILTLLFNKVPIAILSI